MRRLLFLCSALALASVTPFATAGLPPSRTCAPGTTVTAVQQPGGVVRLQSPRGEVSARRAPARHSAAARSGAVVTILARAIHFDADGDVVGTERDTVIVTPGTTIRFELAAGVHTVTNGFDSSDPNAGLLFSVLLEPDYPIFDTTLTTPTQFDYFCFFHEPVMGGTIIVRPTADVPGGLPSRRATFSRAPSPNPARGAIDFAVALPRSASVRLDVLDLAGRRLRTLHTGALSGGEHAFHWDGQSERGGRVAAGRYQIRFTADGASETRTVTVLR